MDSRSLFVSSALAFIASATLFVFQGYYYHWYVYPVLFLVVFAVSYTGMFIVFVARQKKIIGQLSDQLGEELHIPPHTFSDSLGMIEKQLDALIRERKKEIEHLKKLETYRKEYVGNVSHELKTPIFNIQGYISTLLEGGLEDATVNRKFLEKAEKSVERMTTIVEDLQTITQLEAGNLVLEIENFDVVALAKDVCDVMDLRARTKNIFLSARDNDKPVFVTGDRFRLRQVITNLIVNSIKYGKEGGETRIKIRDSGDHVLVEVSDNGIGIDAKHLPRLFERFYRVDKSRSREMGGSGLGLSIVKHILEAHNQTIHVMSTPGAGSVFSFTLTKAKSSS